MHSPLDGQVAVPAAASKAAVVLRKQLAVLLRNALYRGQVAVAAVTSNWLLCWQLHRLHAETSH
jgi:hypothetical protein